MICPGLIGSLCFFYGFPLLHAGIASLMVDGMEPVLAAMLAFLFLGERMTWLQITGMLLIIGCVMCVMILSFSKVDQTAQ
jgi:drug/metabolite transporter (DMT)-like permease